LSDVGIVVKQGYVLFGIEVHPKDGREPTVSLEFKPGMTLGEALNQIFQQIPDYRFEVCGAAPGERVSEGGKVDPNDVLNLRVARLDISNQEAAGILFRPYDFIPELKDRLSPPKTGRPRPTFYMPPGLSGGGPKISLHLHNVTVRQVLNAVSEAFAANTSPSETPTGWVYSFQPDPGLPAGGALRFIIESKVEKGGGGGRPACVVAGDRADYRKLASALCRVPNRHNHRAGAWRSLAADCSP